MEQNKQIKGAKEQTQKTYRDAEACVFTPTGFS